MTACFAGVALILLCAPPDHLQHNPVYQKLLQEGVTAGADQARTLPSPTMTDGLDANAQTQLIKELGGRRFPYSELTRRSVEAKFIYAQDKEEVGKVTIYRKADFWFVAYGDFNKLKDKDFLDGLLNSNNKKEVKSSGSLEAPQLQARQIVIQDAEHEGIGHAVVEILETVDLHLTGWSYWSETADSIVLAAMADPRFDDDTEFPNQWTPSAHPDQLHKFRGAGIYMKFTKLQEPAGAIFVEGHLIMAEPYAWFAGGPRLSSKLSLAVSDKIKSLRRQLARR